MFYVYVLLSQRNSDLYIGYTNNLKKRFREHNSGKVRATSGNRPWKLVYYEGYVGKYDATRREKQLKMHKTKSDLKQQIRYSLKI